MSQIVATITLQLLNEKTQTFLDKKLYHDSRNGSINFFLKLVDQDGKASFIYELKIYVI